MFSYFKNGIKDVTQEKLIDINTLVKMIKNNPHVSKIEIIRQIRANGKDYSKVKKSLPNVTPGGIFFERNGTSFQQSSGYIYLDIDTIEDAQKTKQELISNYGDIISMICYSCSGKGLSILLKPEGIEISKENYTLIWKHITEDFFPEYCFDKSTKDVTRAWFISHDPDVYYNPDSFIEIKKSISPTIYNPSTRLVGLTPSCKADYVNTFLPIREVLATLKFKIAVEVRNKIFDIIPVEYCDVYFPARYKIPNGEKLAIFISTIHKLVFLNPGVEPIYILSYLNFLNNTKTVERASVRNFTSLFNMVYNGIMKDGELNPNTRIKQIHFRENTISSSEKKRISSKLTGLIKQAESIEKIQITKEILKAKNEKATQIAVLKLINEIAAEGDYKGISISTVKRYWNADYIDLANIEKEWNESIQITYISKDETCNNGVSDTQILDQNKNAA